MGLSKATQLLSPVQAPSVRVGEGRRDDPAGDASPLCLPSPLPPQDFICVSYLEPEQQSRTLASRADTLAEALCAQCAEKFEVSQPQDHRLFVLVDGRCFQLADEALPHRIKGYLLRSEPKRDFHFVYRPLDGGGGGGGPPCLVVREPNFL